MQVWNPAPSSIDTTGKSLPNRTVTIAGSFAVDGLEAPLLVWLNQILGIESTLTLQWAPYVNS
jgi:hypothetical protein